ncbi:MAG: DUF3823 domain-containing protein [Bacteroidales bacterium]|nr:DUF3823 domain-containing protein [Bacteroidales bacterium]
MKHILNTILSVAVLFCLASCMKIDNFDAPQAKISGNLIDKTTGKNMLLDHGTTHIRIWERSYSTNPTPQDLAIKMDGSYNNERLFSGTYDMLPLDGSFWPCDTTYNVAIGKKGAVQDFEVVPYLHVVDFTTELNGAELTLSARLQAPIPTGLPQILEVRPFLSLNQFCGAGNRIDYYYTDSYRVNIRKNWEKIGTADGEGNEVYSVTLPVKPGYTYWCRMGVQINNTYKSWNYSEIKKIEVPAAN